MYGKVADERIAALARGRFGVFTHSQALAVGLTSSTIARRVAEKRWERLLPAVYRIAGAPPGREQKAMAATLWAGAGSAVSHGSAARLHGIGNPSREITEVTDVISPRNLRPPYPDLVIRRRRLGPDDVSGHGPIPITSVVRTIIDLAAVVPARSLELCLDDALRKGLVSLEAVRTRFLQSAARGRNGTAALREALLARDPSYRPTDSPLEDHLLLLLERHGIPSPARQVIVCRGDEVIARLDFAYPRAKIAIECDGYDAHGNRLAFQADRARSNALRLEGWLLLQYTWEDVVRRPSAVAAQVAGARRRRINEICT